MSKGHAQPLSIGYAIPPLDVCVEHFGKEAFRKLQIEKQVESDSDTGDVEDNGKHENSHLGTTKDNVTATDILNLSLPQRFCRLRNLRLVLFLQG